MLNKLIEQKQNLQIINGKKVNELIRKEIKSLTLEEINYLESLVWKDYFRNLKGGFSPFSHSPLQGLKEWAIFHDYDASNIYGVEVEMRIKINKVKHKKQLVLRFRNKLLNRSKQEYAKLIFDLEYKNTSRNNYAGIIINYELTNNTYLNEEDRINKLVRKPIRELNDNDKYFIENYRWLRKIHNARGDFYPFYNSLLQDYVKEWLPIIYSNELDYKGKDVELSVDIDDDNKKKYLNIVALDQDGIKVQNNYNPLRLELANINRFKHGKLITCVKYSQPKDVYKNRINHFHAVMKKMPKERTQFDNNLLESYAWQDYFRDIKGGFTPLPGSRITNIGRLAKEIAGKDVLRNNLFVELRIKSDIVRNRDYLELTLSNKTEEVVNKYNTVYIPIRIIKNKKDIYYKYLTKEAITEKEFIHGVENALKIYEKFMDVLCVAKYGLGRDHQGFLNGYSQYLSEQNDNPEKYNLYKDYALDMDVGRYFMMNYVYQYSQEEIMEYLDLPVFDNINYLRFRCKQVIEYYYTLSQKTRNTDIKIDPLLKKYFRKPKVKEPEYSFFD